MAEVIKRKDEPLDKVLSKFKRQLKEEGTLQELKDRQFFEKPSVTKKKETEAASRRNKRLQKMQEW